MMRGVVIGIGLLLTTLACSEERTLAEGSDDDPTSAAASEEEGEPEQLCGNGVIDPGEDCEPLVDFYVCDECSSDCRFDPVPANEWALELGPVTGVLTGDVLRVGPAGTVYVLDREMLLAVSSAGAIELELGEAQHGFASIEDLAVGTLEDVALLGTIGGTRGLRHMWAEGSFDDHILVEPKPESPRGQIAITEHGITMLDPGQFARSFAFDGTPTWESAEAWEALDNVEGRLVFVNRSHDVEFLAGDGSDVLRWEGVPGVYDGRVASTVAIMIGGSQSTGSGDAVLFATSLWTGERSSHVLAVSLQYGFEVGPYARGLDATPSGWPLGYWEVCNTTTEVFPGCAGYTEEGLGGPEDSYAVPLHVCDAPQVLRIGPDGGVFMITESPAADTWQLVRRTTLR